MSAIVAVSTHIRQWNDHHKGTKSMWGFRSKLFYGNVEGFLPDQIDVRGHRFTFTWFLLQESSFYDGKTIYPAFKYIPRVWDKDRHAETLSFPEWEQLPDLYVIDQ